MVSKFVGFLLLFGFSTFFCQTWNNKERQNIGLRPNFPPSGDRKKIILHLPCLHWKTIKLILFVSCCQLRRDKILIQGMRQQRDSPSFGWDVDKINMINLYYIGVILKWCQRERFCFVLASSNKLTDSVWPTNKISAHTKSFS